MYSIWLVTNPPAEQAWTATSYFENFKCLVGAHERPKREWDYHCILELCVGDNPHADRGGSESIKWLIRVLSCVFTTHLNSKDKIAMLQNEGIKNISEEFKKELSEMTTYGQGCFDNGYSHGYGNGVENGRELERKQIVINLFKNGFDKSIIKNITSYDPKEIEEIVKEYELKFNNLKK